MAVGIVGKSRLVYEFVHSRLTLGWLLLESASVLYGKAMLYFPLVDDALFGGGIGAQHAAPLQALKV